MIDYRKCLIKYIGHSDFVIGTDIIFKNDGDGIYIYYFDVEGVIAPSIQDLVDIYESNPELYGVSEENNGNTLVRYGIGSFELDSRINVLLKLNTLITDSNNEFNGTIFTSSKAQKINLSIKNCVDKIQKNKRFEITIVKNNTETVGRFIYSFSDDVNNITVIDNIFLLLEENDYLYLEYYNSDRNSISISDIELNIVGVA